MKDDGELYIDVNLIDYEEETLKNFAKLVASLASPALQIETINMIKDGFDNSGKQEECRRLLIEIATLAVKDNDVQDFLDGNKKEDEPCIKPTDLF
tara:strand:- start:411 stop:698 length:288 start_codon:yes stop_codon:yes gene_type:complete